MTDSSADGTIDRTPWPVNRLSYQDLKATELDVVEKLFATRSDSPLLMKWVMQHKRSGGFCKRLLVISALRVWLLRSKKPIRTSIEQVSVYQIIHITKIAVMRCVNSVGSHTKTEASLPSSDSSATTSIKIEFGASTSCGVSATNAISDDGVAKILAVHIDPGAHSESIARILQRQLHLLRLSFESLPPIIFPPQCNWRENLNKDNTKLVKEDCADLVEEDLQAQFVAISNAYRAFCDDGGAPYREGVMTRLQECISSTSCLDFQYCLATPAGDGVHQSSEDPATHGNGHGVINYPEHGRLGRVSSAVLRCLGLGPPSRKTVLMRESLALARAIEHANCVDNIVIRQMRVKDEGVAALFQSLLSPASSVSGLALNRIRLSAASLRILQNVILQSTLQQNHATNTKAQAAEQRQLRRLDLSFNRFSQKMAVELAVTLELLPLGLELLQLEKCSLTEPASSLLLSSLGANAAFSGSLCELNLSGNHLGCKGTAVLATWLTGAFSLRQLDVSRTALDTNTFSLALQSNSILSESALVHLDISFNRMRTQASQALGSVLGKTRSLSTLVLRGMKRFHVARITVGHSTSDGSGSTLFRFQRAKRGAPTTFRPRHSHGLKKLYLQNILGPMLTNNARSQTCMIDLSENDLRGKKAEVLAQLLDASPPAARYSLRLDHACLHDKSVSYCNCLDITRWVLRLTMLPRTWQSLLLLHSIRACSELQSLSLEGNGFIKRDVQRVRVAESEKTNTPIECPERHSQEAINSLERAAAQVLSLIVGGMRSKEAGTLASPRKNSISLEGAEPKSSPIPSLPSNRVFISKLQELSLKSYSSFVFGSHTILAVVNALPFTTSLRVLDVTGNMCGDALAQTLGRALPCNFSLRTLFWDDNWTSVDGFVAFNAGLLGNKSLTMVQMPIQDTRRVRVRIVKCFRMLDLA